MVITANPIPDPTFSIATIHLVENPAWVGWRLLLLLRLARTRGRQSCLHRRASPEMSSLCPKSTDSRVFAMVRSGLKILAGLQLSHSLDFPFLVTLSWCRIPQVTRPSLPPTSVLCWIQLRRFRFLIYRLPGNYTSRLGRGIVMK
jgi:hypothetical protein